MGLAVVNRTQGGNGASGTDYTAPVQNNTAGNLLVAMMTNQVAANVSSVSNTAGDAFVRAGSELGPITGNYWNIYYAKNILGNASNQVTVHLTNPSAYRSVVVYEISGANVTDPLNTTATGQAIDTNITTGVITLAAAQEIICALILQQPTISGGSGYTLVNFGLGLPDPIAYFADEYHVTSSSEAATATSTSGTEYGILAASFKAAARFVLIPS